MNDLLIILAFNIMCLLPMIAWLLGAFLLGWLLKHLFGREKKELADLHIRHNLLNETHNNYMEESDHKYQDLEHRYSIISHDYDVAVQDSIRLLAAEERIAELEHRLTQKPDEVRTSATENLREVDSRSIADKNIVPLPDDSTRFYHAISGFYGSEITPDDLKLVEGIGPGIEKLLHDAGLTTWASVAEATPGRLKEILDAGGDQFTMHDPATWPEQCRLMVEDKWAELKRYQEELIAGRSDTQ